MIKTILLFSLGFIQYKSEPLITTNLKASQSNFNSLLKFQQNIPQLAEKCTESLSQNSEKTTHISPIILFSPPIEEQKETCTDRIVKEINQANSSIQIQAYSFTSEPIIQALENAKQKGVHIILIIDKTYAKKACTKRLAKAGAEIYVDILKGKNRKENRGIAHNKIMIIDRKITITGSFNFTNAAEHNNTENVLILKDKNSTDQYLANFKARQQNSISLELAEKIHIKSNKKRKKWKRKKKGKCKQSSEKLELYEGYSLSTPTPKRVEPMKVTKIPLPDYRN